LPQGESHSIAPSEALIAFPQESQIHSFNGFNFGML
jgi:hypothetical protein